MSDTFAEIDGTWGFRLEAAPMHPGLIASGFPWWDPAPHRECMSSLRRRGSRSSRSSATGAPDVSMRTATAASTLRYRPGTAERALIRRGSLERRGSTWQPGRSGSCRW